MNEKEWKKIIGYFIPIIALAIANIFQITDVAHVESIITMITTGLLTAIAGVIGLIGVIKSHDKNKNK